MAIEGLKSPNAPTVMGINVTDRAALAVKAFEMLGRVDDRDRLYEGIKGEFDQLVTASLDGETYVQPVFGREFTPQNMFAAVDTGTYPDDRAYPVTYPLDQSENNVSRRLWFPKNSDEEGYSLAKINRLAVVAKGEDEPVVRPPHARLALANGPNSEEPLLHLLDLPYDNTYAEPGETTQLEALRSMQSQFAEQHGGLELNATNLGGFAILALQRRIEGKSMPMSWGFMRIPQLGRTAVDGASCVGRVRSDGSRLRLGRSYGLAFPLGGVGLSVGQTAETLNP